MTDKAFRFGVVAAAGGSGADWQQTAKRAEELGYSTLLSPDNLNLPTPTAALAVAAAATTTLRVGSFVLAGPLRTPRAAAWEAHSLTQLTDGRFELGLGTGLPTMRQQAEELGLPYGSGQDRLDQLSEAIDHVRRLDGALNGGVHTPVMIAAGGPKARRLAAAKADIVALAGGVLTTRAEMAGYVQEIRTAAGARADDIELSLNLFVVGDEAPPWLSGFLGGLDAKTLIEHDSLTVLNGDLDAMTGELERRREELGVSYLSVNGAFLEAFAPVVERLAGK
ncbi:LLM class flavin-dependent oxidoreductase [Amycolatopsis rhabdoformis]|uniref:LLM class flavin-dependent oxidoreductase n=1 Tax=Amycolatopsis rhabdoformis TaxID=1448059 RepID=A0ABZ1ICK8_9PSEU|nr:LLM class flavin-dependent oxidoreductase [Amycolatopsis rhabdoformis]WSE31779.1 LLM class flavin-dependent oxidoreductase [Amycolatopsis rhabdoformis]